VLIIFPQHAVHVVCCFYAAEKPRIVESPKDVVAKETQNVIFHCRATGDPTPTVIWKKLDGKIAADR